MPITLAKLFSETATVSFPFMGETVNVTWAPHRYTGKMQDLYDETAIAGETNDDAIAAMRAELEEANRDLAALAEAEEDADEEALEAKRREVASLTRKLNATIRRNEANARALVREALSTLLVTWDVLDDAGKPLPTDVATLSTLPPAFLWAVFGALGGENEADPPNAPSSEDSSSTARGSAPSPSGTSSSEVPVPSASRRSRSTNGRGAPAGTRSG